MPAKEEMLMSATVQNVFDRVVSHLFSQGQPSGYIDEDGDECCRYRLQKGDRILSCAAGCLIDDRFYSSEIEGKPPNDPRVRVAIVQSLGLFEDRCGVFDVISHLQEIHDGQVRISKKDGSWGQGGLQLHDQLLLLCKSFGIDTRALKRSYHEYLQKITY